MALVVATTSAEIYQSRQMLCTVAIKDEEEKIVAKFIRVLNGFSMNTNVKHINSWAWYGQKEGTQ